jgi:hypothetical protein
MTFSLFRIAPKVRGLSFQFFFLNPDQFIIDVKETSSAHHGAQQGL